MRYVVRLGDGNDPGETVAIYESRATPEHIIKAYGLRCGALSIAVKKRSVSADSTEAALVCEGDPVRVRSDDVWIVAKRAAGAAETQVRITVGPGLTLIYNF